MPMKSTNALLAAAVVTTLSGAGFVPSVSVASDTVSIEQAENANAWFVQLRSRPIIEGGKATALARERTNLEAALKAAGISAKQRFDFRHTWNGVSLQMSARDANRVARIAGVTAVFPVVQIEAPEKAQVMRGEIAPDVINAVNQTGVLPARAAGWDGTGVKVGIIDTGVDHDHPDLGSGFGPGNKVAYGFDFVGDDYNASGSGDALIPVPDDDPDDCNGHGTHVAGITGAKEAAPGGVTGVAPEVTLGAYRVFGCAGSSSADVINAAIERAYLDGMDVINMSLGAALQWPQYPTVYASATVAKAGMIVIASVGNNGGTGTFSLGAPGVGSGVTNVASFDNEKVFLNVATVNGTSIGYQPLTFSPPVPTSGSEEIVDVGRGCVDADVNAPGNQTDPYLADPNGKLALIVRGACSFNEKYLRAVGAGATGVVIYNSVPGNFAGTLGAAPAGDEPGVSISQAAGNFIKAQAAPISFEWTDEADFFPNVTANLLSSFSSYGLSPTLELKPDVGAPGGSILSTYPLEAGGYAFLSGTSMSSPHTAGAVAMMLQAMPGMSPLQVREALQNHADPKVWSGNPGLGLIDIAARQGAGMIDVDDTINATTGVSPSKLSLGEGAAGPQTRTMTVRNWGAEDVTYNLTSVNSVTVGRGIAPSGTTAQPTAFALSFTLGAAAVNVMTPSVTVPAGGNAVAKVRITPDARVNAIYGGYLVFTPTNGGAALRVPFGGFGGDYQAIQPLDGFNNNPTFPWLATLDAGLFTNQPLGATFTLEGGDNPWFLVHANHHILRLEFQVVDAATGEPLDPTYSNFNVEQYLGRNGTRTLFYDFEWLGDRIADAAGTRVDVPDGQYKVNVRALKAGGVASNPAHWQIWTSPVVTIDRP